MMAGYGPFADGLARLLLPVKLQLPPPPSTLSALLAHLHGHVTAAVGEAAKTLAEASTASASSEAAGGGSTTTAKVRRHPSYQRLLPPVAGLLGLLACLLPSVVDRAC